MAPSIKECALGRWLGRGAVVSLVGDAGWQPYPRVIASSFVSWLILGQGRNLYYLSA
jgi:hypothetical protein